MLLVEKSEQIVQQCCEGQDYPSDLLLCSKLPQYWVCENSESDQTQSQTEIYYIVLDPKTKGQKTKGPQNDYVACINYLYDMNESLTRSY